MVITLIGMSGSGKSSVAEHLAYLAGGTLLDIDKIIEGEEDEVLEHVLARAGEEEFLQKEARAALALNIEENTIISTGGSIVLSPEAMTFLKEHSTVIYLQTDFEIIEKRIGEGGGRGIVSLGRKSLREIYDERLPLYEQYADATVDVSHGSAEEVAARAYTLVQNL